MIQQLKTKALQLPAHNRYRQAHAQTSPQNQKNQEFRQTQRKRKKTPSFPERIAAPTKSSNSASTQ
jgi:hypothetical protein